MRYVISAQSWSYSTAESKEKNFSNRKARSKKNEANDVYAPVENNEDNVLLHRDSRRFIDVETEESSEEESDVSYPREEVGMTELGNGDVITEKEQAPLLKKNSGRQKKNKSKKGKDRNATNNDIIRTEDTYV